MFRPVLSNWKAFSLTSCVFWIFFQNAGSQLCFRFFFKDFKPNIVWMYPTVIRVSSKYHNVFWVVVVSTGNQLPWHLLYWLQGMASLEIVHRTKQNQLSYLWMIGIADLLLQISWLLVTTVPETNTLLSPILLWISRFLVIKVPDANTSQSYSPVNFKTSGTQGSLGARR